MPKLICRGWQLAALALVFCVSKAGLPVIEAQEQNPELEPSGKKLASSNWTGFQNGGQPMIGSGMLPTNWSPNAGSFAWQAPIEGYGQSTPVIWDEQVFVTSTSGANKEQCHLSAYDLNEGKRLWKKDFSNPTPEEKTAYVSLAAPTPIVDANGLLALFEGGLLVATDLDGAERWQRNLVAEYGPIKARHGLAASLEQNDSNAFVWIERNEQPYLLAVSKSTGETVWKVPGLNATSWASPRLVPTEHGPHLVASASGKAVGFDPISGERLWELSGIENNSTCTPVPCGLGKFLIGASDGRGEESRGSGTPSSGVVQIVRDPTSGVYSADYLWRAEKASCSFGSPVASDTRAFIVNRSGVLFQLDLATGEETSAARVKAGSIWATPVITNDQLYLFGHKGTTSIVSLTSGKEEQSCVLWAEPTEAPAEGESAATASGGSVLYAAAAAPPYLILRQGSKLTAIK